jgi:hypothetical protein
MGTLNAFYVKTSSDSVITAIRARFPSATVEPGDGFVGFIMPVNTPQPPATALVQLSVDFSTDVIWLSFQSVVDAFEFHHWRGGQALRSLVYGCYKEERMWERVEGEAEPWEREAFFSPYPAKMVVLENARREQERICREAVLLPGRFEPGISARVGS